MPEIRVPSRSPALLAACGLALAAASPVMGQSDPLSEPFGPSFDIGLLLPSRGGDGSLGVVLEGFAEGDRTGFSVANVGDVNGDGLDDVLIGAPRADFGGQPDSGSAYLIFGRRGDDLPVVNVADLDGVIGVRIDGHATGSQAGYSVSGGGDVNGDGIDDLVIGAPFASGNRGAAFVVFGLPAGATWPPTISLRDLFEERVVRLTGWDEGADRRSFAGLGVGGGGDINGDGFDDLVIGNTLNATSVVYGGALPVETELRTLAPPRGFRAAGSSDDSGSRVAIAKDINGDGLDDLLIGSPSSMRERTCYGMYQCYWFTAGRAFVLLGRDTSTTPFEYPQSLLPSISQGRLRLRTNKFGAELGTSVAGVGDINADGFADFAIGLPGVTRESIFENEDDGEAIVVFGRPAGEFAADLNVDMIEAADGFRLVYVPFAVVGRSLSGVGDVNGDGIDDMIISSHGIASATIVFGRNDGFTVDYWPGRDEGVHLFSTDRFDRTGWAVSGGGDFNGDGTPDVVIGAIWADSPSGESVGRAYVVFGRRTPCPPDLDADGTLTIFDFLAFQNLFDLMDPRADFDGDGDFTLFDFLAFQNEFDAGCP